MRKTCLNWRAPALALSLAVTAALAADRYRAGGGTWDTSTPDWGTVSGIYGTATWNNGTPDSAILESPAGTLTLTEPITIRHLRFTDVGGFTLSGEPLSFVAGGTITNSVTANQTITCGIHGSPDVAIIDTSSATITFAPTAATQTLGICTVPYEGGISDKASIEFGGTTTNNSVIQVRYQTSPDNHWGAMRKTGSGTWTVGDVDIGNLTINGGILVVTGTVHMYYGGLTVNSGGELHYNNPAAVYSGLSLYGGRLDNASGAPILTSTHNPAQNWNGAWTFVGSRGADSDLNLGAGAVTLNGHTTVTVSNALTALTVDGVIGDGTRYWGLTKRGAGTLVLTASNTYNGATTVDEGELRISEAYLDDRRDVVVSNSARLHLGFSGTDTVFAVRFDGVLAPSGTWGSVTSAATYKTNVLTGMGVLYNLGRVVPSGTWYWDGLSTNGTGDGWCDGGPGTWSTTVTNWDRGYTNRAAWNNTTNDTAIFRTAAGLVELGSDITLGRLLIDEIDGYTIGADTEIHALHFGGTNSIRIDQARTYIRSGVSGRPALDVYCGSSDPVYLRPKGGDMALGTVFIGGAPQNNPLLELGGTTGSNSIDRIVNRNNWSFLDKKGTSRWRLGDVTVGTIRLYDGTLAINGTFNRSYLGLQFNGGTLAGTGTINTAVTVPAGGTISPGDSTGTLTITNNSCTVNGTFAAHVDTHRLPPMGTLAVNNTLNIGNATLDVSFGTDASGDFIIATYGTLLGEFAATNPLPPGWEVEYEYKGAHAIALRGPPGGTVLKVR